MGLGGLNPFVFYVYGTGKNTILYWFRENAMYRTVLVPYLNDSRL